MRAKKKPPKEGLSNLKMLLLAIFVTLTEHIVESGDLALAAFDFARLFKVTLLADIANDAFAVNLLL